MNKIYIYVEGRSDKEFLECCLRHWGKLESFEININMNSNTIKGNLLNKIKSHKDNDEQVLIVFDADKDSNKTRDRILKESQKLIANQEIFLFPDNQNNGELEFLLLKIARDKKPYECFKCYMDCLGELKVNVSKKSAMFAYREAMGAEKNIKEKIETIQKEFERIFDFDSNALNPLREFMEQAIKRLNSQE